MKPQYRATPLGRPGRGTEPVLEAQVLRYLLNPRGEVEGYLMAEGTFVRFPAHLGQELVQVAGPGDTVRANGHWEGEATLRGHVIFNPVRGVALRDLRPSLPDRAAGAPLIPMQVSGRIAYLKLNGRGDVDAAILEDGSFVHIPPHSTRRQFVKLIEVGSALFARGFGTETLHGRSLTAALLGPSADGLELVEPAPARHGPGARPHAGKSGRREPPEEEDSEE